MSKKIMLLFMLTIVTMQTNFAMEQKRSSMVLTKLMDGRFTNGLVINKFSLSHRMDKKSQALNSQLQQLESNKNNLEHENDQIIQDIQKNIDARFWNENKQMGAIGVGAGLEVITGGISGGFLTGLGFYVATVMQGNNMELDEYIGQNKLRLQGNNEQLSQINHDAAKTNFALTKVNEHENRLKKIHALNKKTKWVGYIFVQAGKKSDMEFDYPIHESITVVRDSIEPIDRWLYEQELHRIFSGSDVDSESTMMSPYHPGHDNLVSNFFISSSDASDNDHQVHCNESPVLCFSVWKIVDGRSQETSDEGPVLEVPSDTDWDSDALEYHHNWALLTDDAYLPYTNVQDFLHAQNNS